jgi:hypothetical protein
LFRTSRTIQAAERALDKQIGALVTTFLQAKTVAAPADLAALAEDFVDSEMPPEPVTPSRYVDHLAANVVPYCNRIASPRSLAHMSQGLRLFSFGGGRRVRRSWAGGLRPGTAASGYRQE